LEIKEGFYTNYANSLSEQLIKYDWSLVEQFAQDLHVLWEKRNRLFLCGNGGSAANALHLANDFIYGVNPEGMAIDAEALSANSAVVTCLGNDIGYDKIFSHQVELKASDGDILLVLSGSGNSSNIAHALLAARKKNVKTYAILGYNGGKAKLLADVALHFPIDDMQISEDLQVILGHMLMRRLNQLITS
jgi:D-sedoheptulose 7-phosphate isomerase